MSTSIYYLELIFISVNILQQQKLMKKNIPTDILFLKKKGKKHQKKNFVVNLLELIQVMQKIVMIQIKRLVMYKHLLISSTLKSRKTRKKLIKEKEMTEKIEKELKDENKELKKKKNLTTKLLVILEK